MYITRAINQKHFIKIIFLIVFLLSNQSFSQKLIVGYYPHWLKSDLPTSKIEFNKLTHIIHSFAWPTADGEIEIYSGMLDPALNSKVHEENKKILLAFGGATLSDGFAPMVTDSLIRAKFVDNVYNFLTDHNYDGIDIDWEFPQNAEEKIGLVKLVKELREKFNANNPSLIISMAIGSSHWSGEHFEFEEMVEDLDWFAMMGYDMAGSWMSFAGHNAPLFRGNNGWSWNDGYMYLHFTRKIPNEKLVLGLPFYGKQFFASDLYEAHSDTVIDLRYNQISNLRDIENWDYFWDDVAKVPYLLNAERTKFITYDDTTSIKAKVEYALEKNVAGIMIWALGQDVIGDTQPLLEVIWETINASVSVETEIVQISKNYKLFNNYPNPFNPTTTIKYYIPNNSHVKIKIYNSMGQLIETLIDQNQNRGLHEIEFNSKSISSGIYFYKLITDNYINTKGMILLK